MRTSKKSTKNGLNIIIVGYGKVGSALIEHLSREGHDITLIDRDPDKIQAAANLYDIMGIAGNGASYNVQMEAGIEGADLLIAVTGSDELNLLCCTIARRVADCAAIARVRTPDYSTEAGYLQDQLGLAMIINPELEAAKEAARILALPTALEVSPFAHGQAEMINYKIPSGSILDGLAIKNLNKHIKCNILICAVERNGEVHIPSGAFTVQAGDIISFAGNTKIAKKFMQEIGVSTHKVKDTLIIGGGRATYYLANQLLQMGVNVKIIEKDRKRCEELSILLPKAIIINGDGTNEELLREEGIEYVESFVPLTGMDEENVMLSLHAKQTSKAKIITKINHINFKTVINQLDLGSLIYPRHITSGAIIAYVRAKKNSLDSNIETLYHLFDHRAEAIEFRVAEQSNATNISLAELPLKNNLLIAFINRNGKIIIPNGNDCIKVGDTVMVVTTHTGFRDIRDILR